MIKCFPFSSTFDLKMGTSLMKEEDAIVEVDQHYYSEIKLKRSLLEVDHSYYFASLPETNLAQWEVVEKVANDLVKLDSTSFSLTKNGLNLEFRNALLKEEITWTLGDERSIPLGPMDWIGRQIQEDLVLLNPLGEVVDAQLCFPSGCERGV